MVAAEPGLWGLPVIAPRSGGLREVIDDGVTGLLYTPGSVASLTEAIARLASSRELRARLGEAGRRRVVERFTPGPVVDAYEQELEALCRQNGRW